MPALDTMSRDAVEASVHRKSAAIDRNRAALERSGLDSGPADADIVLEHFKYFF
jgi:hypothetical protein